MTNLLSVDSLSVVYGSGRNAAKVVSNVSFEIGYGESFGLVGESGCGKSTLAMAIMKHLGRGVEASGKIEIDGHDMSMMSSTELRRFRANHVSMVYQEPMSALNPRLKIKSQLNEILAVGSISNVEADGRITEVLQAVQLPDPMRILNSYSFQLSGGQQQRVVIAMALLARPSLMLLDEPTTALDVTVQAAIVDLIADIRRKTQMGMLFISHDLPLVAQVCDRVAVMYRGEIVEVGDTKIIMENPAHPYTRALLACTPRIAARGRKAVVHGIAKSVEDGAEIGSGCSFANRCSERQADPCDIKHPSLLPVSDSSLVARCHFAVSNRTRISWTDVDRLATEKENDVVLSVKSLTRGFGQGRFQKTPVVLANDRVSFSLRRQETLAIVGESGSGKSTLAKMLIGLTEPTSGEIYFHDEQLHSLSSGKRSTRAIAGIQMVFQNPDGTLNPARTVGSSLYRSIKKLCGPIKGDALNHRAASLSASVELNVSILERHPSQISGGQKQRVSIARAFAGSPEILIADEAVSALDVSVRASILDVLKRMQFEYGTSIIFISHDMAVVNSFADKVMVMYMGQVVDGGTIDEIFNGPVHPYTEKLLAAALRLEHDGGGDLRGGASSSPKKSTNTVKGCIYSTVCHRKIGSLCDESEPAMLPRQSGFGVKCHLTLQELQGQTTDTPIG